MSKRNYDRLSIEEFGQHLLKSGDLDPIYIALHNAFPLRLAGQLDRWLIAYWCLYHAGSACWLSEREGPAFWEGLMKAAKNDAPSPTGERWQRGHERRHFRGEAAVKAVRTMWGKFHDRPEALVDMITDAPDALEDHLPFTLVAERAQTLPLFGPWISFKVGDMLDRVLGIPVEFNNSAVFMFKDPTEAALRMWRLKAGFPEPTDKNAPRVQPKDKDKAIQEVVDYLIAHFRNFRAPPLNDRAVGLQEVETILCKWKSHMNGHYPLYNDIDEINDGVQPWIEHSQVAKRFAAAMPQNPQRSR